MTHMPLNQDERPENSPRDEPVWTVIEPVDDRPGWLAALLCRGLSLAAGYGFLMLDRWMLEAGGTVSVGDLVLIVITGLISLLFVVLGTLGTRKTVVGVWKTFGEALLFLLRVLIL